MDIIKIIKLNYYPKKDYSLIVKEKQDLHCKLLADFKKTSLNKLRKEMKIPYGTLWRIIHNASPGSMSTWEKIEAHYKKNGST